VSEDRIQRSTRAAMELMYRAAGSTSFQRESRLAECWRDLHTAARRSPSRPNGTRSAAASISAWTPPAPALAHSERTAPRPACEQWRGYGSNAPFRGEGEEGPKSPRRPVSARLPQPVDADLALWWKGVGIGDDDDD
jgi:hypothetical protein